MNTQEIERLQNALAGFAAVIAKIVTERVDQALAEVLPVKLPSNQSDKSNGDRILTKKQVAEVLRCRWTGSGLA